MASASQDPDADVPRKGYHLAVGTDPLVPVPPRGQAAHAGQEMQVAVRVHSSSDGHGGGIRRLLLHQRLRADRTWRRSKVRGVSGSLSPPSTDDHVLQPDALLYFISPKDGDRIRGPVVVQFGLKNMGVTQAGSTAANAGHHHLLVNVKTPLLTTEPIPADRNHIHFGGGQTETTLDLPPGQHTLQLALGDAEHRLFQPLVMSERITITVLGPKRRARRR